jgi:serine phosphatase RsbU (regulator of sigma subunit)
VRAVLGDVQGHGLAAVSTVAALLGSFREAVLARSDLTEVVAALDRRLVVDSAEARHAELFATAVLLEFSGDGRSVRVLTCGHPPPILLRDGTASEIEVAPWTPLGLGLLDGLPRQDESTVPLHPGDVLFLASDGVTEARNSHGAFYPLLERLPRLADRDPAGLADHVLADLLAHCGNIRDDVTMLALAPCPPQGR